MDTLIVFLKELFEKVNFEKKYADDNKSMKNYQACKEINLFSLLILISLTDISALIGGKNFTRENSMSTLTIKTLG